MDLRSERDALQPDLSSPETVVQTSPLGVELSATTTAESQNPDAAKRRRACEGCRRLKVQCHFESPRSETCKRCIKAGRQCIIAQRRRRQVITSTAVNELEKKLAALTASLDAIKSGSELPGGQGKSSSPDSLHNVQLDNSTSNLLDVNQRPRDPLSYFGGDVPAALPTSFMDSKQKLSISGGPPVPSVGRQGHPAAQSRVKSSPDVIDRRLLSLGAAYVAFDHFMCNMVPQFPIVVFPTGTTAAQARTQTPILFLAAVCAASGTLPIEIQRTLNQELMRLFADRILMVGEKSLELIQAVQITAVWYYPPGRYEELKYYQIIHSACIMAIDIGLNRRGKAAVSVGLNESATERPSKRPNPSLAVSRRAWLGCYFLAAQTAQNLRRENLIRWSSYMEECVKHLETSTEGLPNDQILCQWVRLQHIADDVSIQFSIEDPAACAGLDDPKMRFAIQGFESQLKACSSLKLQIPKPATLKLGEFITQLYMHEVALHAGYSNDDMQPPFTEEALKSIRPTQAARLSVGHISSLSTCLSIIHKMFDIFLSFTVDEIRNFPTFHFVRIIYAGVVLTKMAYDATVPNSEIQRMFSSEDFKIDYYLDGLVALLKSAAEGNRCPSAAKFAMVLFVMKALLHKQNNQGQSSSKGLHKESVAQAAPIAEGRGRNDTFFTENNGQHHEPPLPWHATYQPDTSTGVIYSNAVADFSHRNFSSLNLSDNRETTISMHLHGEAAQGHPQMEDSPAPPADQMMDDVYGFDSQGYLLNGQDFPSFFSDDELLNSVLHNVPGNFMSNGLNDSWH